MKDEDVQVTKNYKFDDMCLHRTDPEWEEVTVTGPSDFGEFPWRVVNKIGEKGVASAKELSEL